MFLHHAVHVRFAGSRGLPKILHPPPQPSPAGEGGPPQRWMRSCKRFGLYKPSVAFSLTQTFSPHPPAPLPIREGGETLNIICREASPPAPRGGAECLAGSREFCRNPTSADVLQKSAFPFNESSPKQESSQGVGGTGAETLAPPMVLSPVKETICTKQTHCKFTSSKDTPSFCESSSKQESSQGVGVRGRGTSAPPMVLSPVKE